VALARQLWTALGRFWETGLVPAGAVLTSAQPVSEARASSRHAQRVQAARGGARVGTESRSFGAREPHVSRSHQRCRAHPRVNRAREPKELDNRGHIEGPRWSGDRLPLGADFLRFFRFMSSSVVTI
jgi:hypothetical protein